MAVDSAFQWGSNGERLTADEITQRRKDAAAQLAQATDGTFAPGTRGAGVWTQGLAKVAKAVMAGMDYRDADRASKENADENTKMIAALLGGGSGSTPVAATTSADTAAAPADASAPRGIRNNNPLNIEDGDFARSQPGYVGSDGRFAKFETPDHGTAAASNLIGAYESKHGLNTVSGIVNRWAPPSDGNDTSAYAADVAKRIGIDPNAPLTPAQRPALIAAMGFHENGQPIPGAPVAAVPAGAPAAAPAASPAVLKVAGALPAAAAVAPARAPVVASDDGEETPAAAAVPVAAVPAAPAAASLAVARVSGALSGVNPAVAQVMTSPYASPAAKQIAGLILQQQLGREKKDTYSQHTDAEGNIWSVNNNTNQPTIVKAADKAPQSVNEYEYYKKNLANGQKPMDYATWSTAKARAGAVNVTTNVGGENKGLDEAAKLDAEAVRKGQNELLPALEDADHNFQLMQTAIDRNGGKLPTGGELGKLGLDWNRTKDYIAQNWGIDLGSDPTATTSLETFNKGGIKAAGDMAKAIGGSRVLKAEFDMAQKANPGLETSDAGNKYLLDVNRNGIAVKKDYLQAQEDYWRTHNHSLDGFQKNWNEEIHNNPRPLSSFSVAPPVDGGNGSQFVKLPSTAKGGYSWFQKGPNGTTVLSDPEAIAKLDQSTKQLATPQSAPAEKVIGGKTYIRRDNNWFEK